MSPPVSPPWDELAMAHARGFEDENGTIALQESLNYWRQQAQTYRDMHDRACAEIDIMQDSISDLESKAYASGYHQALEDIYSDK